ncbi:MAG: family transcriptional regulator, cyclic receptor protein [Solirubrobacteraceae bacterium]|nr:family transcriptional regulator, cyclic receptor protein [Solirubrobacteraceae bacterium]
MQWALLDSVPEEDVRRLLVIARRRTFGRGEVVFHEDDPADTLHLISKGRFAVRIQTRLGDTAILSVLGSGQCFGEIALIDGEHARRSATIAALEPAETQSVHRVDFERLCREHPGVREVLVAILAAQVRRLSAHLLDALYVPADRRVLKRLAEIAALYARDGVPETEVPLTQEDLADLAGTSRATVNRVLRAEQERGTVRLRRGRTVVLDRERLSRA